MGSFCACPHETAELAVLRRDLRAWLRAEGVNDDATAAIVLATHEAAANAIEHAEASDTITVRAQFEERGLRVEVSDRGRWREPNARSDRGLGLLLIARLSDHREVAATDDGTTVRMWHFVERG